jgi:hypothetical protein
VGVASVQFDEVVTEDDPAKGLLITIPTRVFNEAADSAPGEPMRLRVNVEKGTLVAEQSRFRKLRDFRGCAWFYVQFEFIFC